MPSPNYIIAKNYSEIQGLENYDILDSKFYTQSLFPIEIWRLVKKDKKNSKELSIIVKNINIPDMAFREVEGLLELENSGATVPRVYGILENRGNYQIIMEYCGFEFHGEKDKSLKENLLSLYNSSVYEKWGEEKINYIGTLEQPNEYYNTFTDYWLESRLQPMIREIEKNQISTDDWKRDLLKKAQASIRLWDLESCKPRRIHGDLWSGNVLYSRESSYLIDPSTSIGNPEQDLAMLSLFGSSLSDTSKEEILASIGQDKDWKTRVDFWLVYPLLIHVVIFGRSYLDPLRRAIASLPG